MRWLAIWCVSGIAACSETAGPPTDEAAPDAKPAFTGLTLDFIADRTLPALIGGDLRIDDIYLNGSLIRAIGDATPPGEQSTTGRDHELHWDDDDEPIDLVFAEAPVGEYSYVELRIASHPSASRSEAFELRGEVRTGGDWTDFAIRADAPVVIANVPASVRLEAGRRATVQIELDVYRLFEGISWSSLPERDGALRLDEQTPAELGTFCASLAAAFRAR